MNKSTAIHDSMVFSGIVLGLSYFVFWGPLAFFKIQTISFVSNTRGPVWAIILFILGGFVPSLAALALTYMQEGRNGLQKMCRNFLRVRIGLKWYAFTIMVFALIGFGQILINRFLGNSFDMSLYIKQSGSLIPLIIIGPISEEFGWRGYLLEKLQICLKPLHASIIVGVIWGLWHLPLFSLIGTSQYELRLPFLSFILSTIAISIIMTSIYNHTGKSIWSAVFAHWIYTYIAQVNSTGVTRSNIYNWLEAVPGVIIALGIALVMSRKRIDTDERT